MITIAFNYIDGRIWRGGHQYIFNLVSALSSFSPDRVRSIIFVGTDIAVEDLRVFEGIERVKVVRNQTFNSSRNNLRLFKAILFGSDNEALNIFLENKVDIVFESARFYGWHFPLPVLTWIPDFQHRYLKKLFGWQAYWKREIGFRVQALSGRHIMLSSEDARGDCEKYYPITKGRTSVVRFCAPPPKLPSIEEASRIVEVYGLPKHFFFLPNQFWAHKNHICVIRAVSILKKRGISVVIVCSGKQADERDPHYFEKIQRHINFNGLGDSLRLLGMIPSAHIMALMMKCAALINPSKFEGWSTTVEEAKVIGVPIILSELRVHKEQCNNAFFFDPDAPDQLANILESFNSSTHGFGDIGGGHFAEVAEINFNKFSEEFTNLIEQQVQIQRGS
ncbi:glycosyltransferase family 4 protein [Polynucleobacter sp. MWH-UH19D]|uniref:glycosyltransferase family 4 protein n=1 Tax=Polynucleobacter sp. MWH-UH19D TaxID=1855610 RepID=UPI0033652CF5